MSKFIPTTRKKGACEVCGDESGKCRRPQDGDIHLCMTFADARKGQIENGYKCIKRDDKGKGWATFKLDDTQDWTAEQRREWKAKAEARKQQAAIEAAARANRSLRAIERDQLYRQLLNELTLHPSDRADLKRRGFSDLEIDLVGYKSIDRNYLQLQGKYPELLPGIAAGGQQLVNLGTGYLCPMRNRDGQIVACQLRVRVLPAGQKNRYRWLSGGDEKQHTPHFFPTNGNPEGELPLAVCRPEGQPPQFVALAEGTGAKPNFVALKWRAFAIGAAGGQWASSPATLRDAIETGIAETGDRCIRLYPDAGDLENRQVAMRWKGIIATLEEWGYALSIGWWNQRTKADQDIDELTPEQFAEVHYLQPKDFLAMVDEQFPEPKGFSPDSTAKTKDDRAWELWRLARKFTPTHTINQQYFDFAVPEPGTLIGIKSGLGTGKTEWLRRVIQTLADEGWIALGYRNSLLIQSASRWGFYHLHQDEAQSLLADPQIKVALCVDSILHFEPHHFDGKNIILDEACSILLHLLFARTAVGRQRRECKAKFAEALKRAKRIFVLDGLLTDKDIDYLQKLIGEPRKIVKVRNEYRGNGKQISILRGATEGDKVKLNNRSPLVEMIQSSPCCAIATDSQIEAEALDKLLSEQGKQVVRLDSKTSAESWVPELLNNTTQWFLTHKPDVFIFTPSAESGVDVPITDYFQHFFCLFFGAILTNAQQQMIGRIRDANCPTFVYCRTTGIPGDKISRAALPEDLVQVVVNYVLADGWATLSDIPHEEAIQQLVQQVAALSQNEHFHYECQRLALQNHEEKNLRECLIEALSEAGHDLKEVLLEKSSIEELRLKKEEVKDLNSEDIYHAETLTMEEVNRIDSKTGLDWKTRCQIQKAKLLDRLPEIEQSDQWSVEFVRKVLYDDRNFLNQCELFWLLHHPDIAKQLQQRKWFNLLRVGQANLTEHRSRYLRVKTMIEAGLPTFLQPDFTWHQHSPEVQQFYEYCKASPQRQTYLGVAVGDQKPVAYLGMVLGKLGLSTLKLEGMLQTDQGRVHAYQIDSEAMADSDRVAVLEAINTRYSDLLEGTGEAIDWDSLCQGSEIAETDAPAAIEADHPLPDFYINKPEGDQIFASLLPDAALSSPAAAVEPIVLSEVLQEPIAAVLPCTENLSEQEVTEFAVCVEFAAESGGEAVQQLWRNWGDRLKRVTLNAVKRQIPVLYQRLEAMLWTSADGYLFL